MLAGGGFLLAVLWFDLMFDVQARRPRRGNLDEAALASIAAYYHRVTTASMPMGYAVGGTMLLLIAGCVRQLWNSAVPTSLALAALLAVALPSVAAMTRIFHHAIRLGHRRDTIAVQSDLARGILRDHLLCLVSVLAFLALQIAAVEYDKG